MNDLYFQPSVLLAINPRWCDLIFPEPGASQKKTYEIRKTKPRLEPPFLCPVYETQTEGDRMWMDEDGHISFRGRGMVVGAFVCDRIIDVDLDSVGLFDRETREYIGADACLTVEEARAYLGVRCGYAWHITNPVRFETPRPLSDFRLPCNWNYDCCTCKLWNPDKYEAFCKRAEPLNRPPQSWCYVESVRRGQWIYREYFGDLSLHVFSCSECGQIVSVDKIEDIKRHPICECGAQIDVSKIPGLHPELVERAGGSGNA